MHLTLGPGQQLSCLFYGRHSRWLHITGEKKERCGLSGPFGCPRQYCFLFQRQFLTP